MGLSIAKAIHPLIVLILLAALVLVIWQPVIPSGWIIRGMADQIDPGNLSIQEPIVLRFELAGKGGGVYNLVLSNEEVVVTEGEIDQVDLLIATTATDFNDLAFQMARGRADEFTAAKLMISNVIRIAGDMSVLEALTPEDEGT